ncbi:transcriptional coactivator p15/PC4 family protein [bacterium]|nr:transcriptional coactivator p15/PC4 family protein [bacterium]
MEQVEVKIGSPKSPIVLSLKEYRGKKLLDVRKYFRTSKDSDEISPTRKGISLTGQQFSMVLDALNEHSKTIEEFYSSTFDLNLDQKLDIAVGPTLGRLFHFSFENNSTTVVLDKELAEKLGDDHSALFVNLLLLFHKALLDSLEDEEDRDLVLDSLNHSIGSSIC